MCCLQPQTPKRKTGTMLSHRARISLPLYFLMSLLHYFFGLDSGGTNPFKR
jgi:hypothetical protein